MKVIDIASYQSVDTAGMDGIDGVIVKTTEGVGYVNPLGDAQYQRAKAKGRLLGIYHYANGGDPVAEANYFYQHSKGYFGEAIPFLDWESGSNAQWGNPNWCRAFVNRIHDLTGVWCGIYIQASALAQVANLASDCPLWIAGYPTNAPGWEVPQFIYSTAPWPNYTLWQFTSGGGLDKNVGNLDAAAWKRIAAGSKGVKPTPIPAIPPGITPPGAYKVVSLEQAAGDAQAGKLGNGQDRANKLGVYNAGVQAIINHRANGGYYEQAIRILVDETKAGRYGNGDARKRMLGNYYNPVQSKIDGGAQPANVYVVKSGDTLSGIGAKLGRDWTALARANNIPNPYVIQPGQQIKY